MSRKSQWLGKSLGWGALACGFTAGFLLLYPQTSNATTFWRRMQATACHPDTVMSGTAFVTGADGSVANKHTTNAAFVFCPVQDDTSLPKTSITSITVNGYDGHPTSSVAVRACGTFEATGGFCGSQVTSSGTGNFALHPVPSSAWTGTNAPYIFAVVPPVSGTVFSKINDVYVSN